MMSRCLVAVTRGLLLALILTRSAQAHIASNSFLSLTVTSSSVTGVVEVSIRDAELAVGIDTNEDNRVTWAELRSVMKHRAVTTETLSMSVSVYLLIGLTWGLLYSVIFQYQPAAFNLGASAPGAAPLPPGQLFPIFIYFSLTTLATIGFGDITPLTLQARYAAVAEGITGQLYLAILVARLVGMHMSAAANADTRA